MKSFVGTIYQYKSQRGHPYYYWFSDGNCAGIEEDDIVLFVDHDSRKDYALVFSPTRGYVQITFGNNNRMAMINWIKIV